MNNTTMIITCCVVYTILKCCFVGWLLFIYYAFSFDFFCFVACLAELRTHYCRLTRRYPTPMLMLRCIFCSFYSAIFISTFLAGYALLWVWSGNKIRPLAGFRCKRQQERGCKNGVADR